MKNEIKKVAIITSGGDAPGMNQTIKRLFEKLDNENVEVYFGFEGYKGLYEDKIFGPFSIKNNDDKIFFMDQSKKLKSIDLNDFNKSGSVLLSSRFKKLDIKDKDTIKIKKNLNQKGINDLFVIGGDGSMLGAQVLSKLGINTYVIPATIDNDFLNSQITIGASSAANMNRLIIESLIATSKTHKAIHVIEIMGRDSAWLTNESVGGLNILAKITNENKKYTPQEAFELIKEKIHFDLIQFEYEPLIAVQELIYDDHWYDEFINLIKNNSPYNARFSKIGYIQRGAFVTNKEIKIVEILVDKIFNFYLTNSHLLKGQQHVVVMDETNSINVLRTI